MKPNYPFLFLILFVPALSSLAVETIQTAQIPDFTRGDTLPARAPHDWTLGPTGARGWIYTADGHSKQARQILVTAVASGSPAASQLNVGDVLLGVDGQAFTGDARVQFANAIAVAESRDGRGKLSLLRWRDKETEVVEIKLPVLGSYSETAPYDCPKSKRIFELGCVSLANRMGKPNYTRRLDPIPRSLNALALLASGKKEYLPLIEREAQWAAGFSVDSFASWYYGYNLIFLTEYFAATGDQSVMPGIKRLALEAARGQSDVGTWGHKFARPDGNLNGYGSMNAPGLSLTIGLVLARKVGVNEPEVDQAIAKASRILRWYVNKGAVPYGDHLPFPGHEDNGKCSSATVLFDLQGDREAAEFFGKMSTAAYNERERGHTGNYFNMLWALQGVSRCGQVAIGAYMKEHAWYYDLARSWDTSFLYQGSPEGEEEHGKYGGWDCTGGYLLGYALPLKSLMITGKIPFSLPPLDAAQVSEVIAAGRDYTKKGTPSLYDNRSAEQLLENLSSWSPFVRKRAAAALAKKKGDFVPTLLTLLASDSPDARYGACEALGALGSRADAAAPQLRAALKDNDPWLQCMAAEAIPNLGPQARRESVSDLLLVTVNKNPADPRHLVARSASVALFSPYPGARGPQSILAQSLDGVDRELLLPAIETLLQHEDSVPRRSVSTIYNKLNDNDLVHLLPYIVKATEKLAPSNEMFGDNIRLAGLDLLSRLHISEGMPLCVSVIENGRWGLGKRFDRCLEYLQRYGSHAKSELPELRKLRSDFAVTRNPPADKIKALDEVIASIESSTSTPTLVSVAQFKSRASK